MRRNEERVGVLCEPIRWTDILIGYGISLAWWSGLLVVLGRFLELALADEYIDPAYRLLVVWAMVLGPVSILIWAIILWRRGWDGFWAFLTPVGVTLGTVGLTWPVAAILQDLGWRDLPYPVHLGVFVVMASCIHLAVAVAWSKIAGG